MDNHVHLLLYAPDAMRLGDFMRTVGSLLARFINKFFDRDSQALKERYKSPIVVGEKHLNTLIAYVCLNRYEVSKLKPQNDYYCSTYWRLNTPFKRNSSSKTDEEKFKNVMARLLDEYESDERFPKSLHTLRNYLALINNAIDTTNKNNSQDFENGYTIADEPVVSYRCQLISAQMREKKPPNYYIDHPD